MTITVDRTSQRFASSAQPEPDVLVLHTTEGMGWPGYNGGGTAPHVTIRPRPGVGIEVREHIAFGNYAKALENRSGGVQTNRRGAVQVELIGTCDPKHRGDSRWYFWPEADAVVLKALADYLRPVLATYKIPHRGPAFVAYPKSYGLRASQRMSGAEWVRFEGICGHQHVPENTHGDPGAFPIGALISALTAPSSARPRPTRRLLEDGSFGPATRRALQTWMVTHYDTRIAIDGDFGPASRKALERVLNHVAPAGWARLKVTGSTTEGSSSVYTSRLRWLTGVNPVKGPWDKATTIALQKYLNKALGY